MRFTIWQCTDFCCELKPHGKRWWNVATRPGFYDSFPTWNEALMSSRDTGSWARFSRWTGAR
jgi:hypothetical protein